MISTTQMRSIMLATALLACDMGSASAGASAFAGSYTRASVSPDECDAPSDCNYQCSASYGITASGTTLTIEPAATDADCACDTLSATVSGNTASGTYGDSLSYDLTLTDSGIIVETTVDGTTCTGKYAVDSVDAFVGSFTRTSVSPDECDAPSDCNYQCSASYDITASGTTLTIEPTATSADCACDTLSATVSGTSASGVVGANLWYDLTLTDSGITVATNVDGTICTGTYKSSSGTTASTPSSTKATTTTATPTTATTTTAKSSAWASSGADLLGLAMTGVVIYYQG